jgi:hypothetical protein
MSENYVPVTLSREQADQLYSDAYAQAEAQEAVAWMNYVRARAAREALKHDWERVQGSALSRNGAERNA